MENRVGLYADNEYWLETFTGKRVSPTHLDEELIDINDIAHSLSMLCRFGGHCLSFYSVAEHSILVAEVVLKELKSNGSPEEHINKTCLAALLHDAAEAYIGDIPRPIKYHPMFKYMPEIEQQIMGKIVHKFKLSGADWELIKKADNIVLATEAQHMMADSGKGWCLPEPALPRMPKLPFAEDVEPTFLSLFEEYGGRL